MAKALASLTVILLLRGRAGLSPARPAGSSSVGNRPLIGLDGHLLCAGGRGRQGAARLGLRAGPDAGARRDRAARVGHARPLPDGAAAARGRRARDADRPDAAAAGRRAPRPARLRLHRLARSVHQPGAARPAADRHRGQPAVGGRRDRAGVLCCSCGATSPTPAYDGSGRRAVTVGVLPLVALLAAHGRRSSRSATPATGSGIEQDKLQRSLATAFAHLYRLQTEQLHRPAVTEAQLQTTATCDKGGGLVAQAAARATTGAASSPGTCPASTPSGRPSTSSTSPQTGGTSPTATDRRKSTATSWCAPRRGRTEPALAVRRQRRPARHHPEGITHAGNTPTPSVTGRSISDSSVARVAGSRLVIGRRRRSRRRRPAGIAYASTHRVRHRPGRPDHRQGPGRVRRPDHQPDRRPPGHQQRQDHVVHGQPGRQPPRRLDHRRRHGAGHRRPEELEGAAARRQLRRRRTCASAATTWARKARRTRPTARSCGWARPTATPGSPSTRTARCANPTSVTIPADGSKQRAGRRRPCSRPTAPPCTPRSTARTAWSPSTRRPAPSSRAGPSATPRVTWSWSAPSSTSATRAAARRQPGDTTINSYGTQVPANPIHRHHHHRHGQRHRPGEPDRGGRRASTSACTRPRCTPRTARCSSPTPTSDTVSVIDTTQRQGRADHRHPAVAGGRRSGYEPDASTLTDDGHLLVTLGRANAVAVYKYTQPAGAGQLHRPAADGLLPGRRRPPSAARSWSPTPAASTPAAPPTAAGHGTHDTTSQPDPVHAAERPRHQGQYTGKVFQQNGWTNELGPGGQGQARRRRCRSRRASATRRRSSTSS